MTALLPEVNPAARGNSSFSTRLPGFQLAIDSTSLGEFKLCPRRYYYSILRGLGPRGGSVHLTFGIWMHTAREKYEVAKLGPQRNLEPRAGPTLDQRARHQDPPKSHPNHRLVSRCLRPG